MDKETLLFGANVISRALKLPVITFIETFLKFPPRFAKKYTGESAPLDWMIKLGSVTTSRTNLVPSNLLSILVFSNKRLMLLELKGTTTRGIASGDSTEALWSL